MTPRRSRLDSLLHDYAAGDLDEAARAEVERLLAGDPRARALFEEICRAREALALLRERPDPPIGAQEALPAIRAAIAADRFVRRPRLSLESFGARYYRRLALAACAMLAVTVGLLVLHDGTPAPAAPAPQGTPTVTVERELVPFVEMDALSFFDMLERQGRSPDELPRYVPTSTVVPIGIQPAERR